MPSRYPPPGRRKQGGSGEGDVEGTFALAALPLHDEHDLINKPVGSRLREAGKKDEARDADRLSSTTRAIKPPRALRRQVPAMATPKSRSSPADARPRRVAGSGRGQYHLPF